MFKILTRELVDDELNLQKNSNISYFKIFDNIITAVIFFIFIKN